MDTKKLQSLPYWILFGIMCLVCAMRISLFDASFPTVDDEAYWLFKIKEAYQGILAGESQWNFIVIRWFPFWDLTSKVHSDVACQILMVVASLIAAFGCAYAIERKDFIKYLAVMMVFLIPVEGRLSYLTLLVFLVTVSMTAFLVYGCSNNPVIQAVMLVFSSAAATLSVFAVPSGGGMVLILLALGVVAMNWKQGFKAVLTAIGWGIFGVVLSFAYMHFFVYDLRAVFQSMIEFMFNNVKTNPYGHNAVSILLSVVEFSKVFLFVVLCYIAAYFLSTKFRPKGNIWAGAVLYFIVIYFVFRYQKAPSIYSSHLFSSVFIIPLLFQEERIVQWRSFFERDTLMQICLAFMPMAAAFGSNGYCGRVGCFAFLWAFLWFMQKDRKVTWYVPAVAILFLLIPLVAGTTKSFFQRDDSYHFTRGNQDFARISILPEQKDYLDRVYDLVKMYGYQPDSSVVFATEYDYFTVYALDAKVSSDFYQPLNFLYWDVSEMLKPDFVIMFGWDEQKIGDRMRDAGWGWPEEFDAYPIGTPETWYVYDEDLDQRTLYCRKSLKRE